MREDNIDKLEVPFDDVLDNILDSMVYGYKCAELIWNEEPIDGKWTWKKFKFMHSYLFEFVYDEWDDLEAVTIGRQVGFSDKVSADEFQHKFLCMVWPYVKDGNYYGDSDLRELYVEWWQRFNILRWRGTYLQGFAFKVPVIKYDWKKTLTSELNDLDSTFDNWQDAMRLKIPSDRDPASGELRGS